MSETTFNPDQLKEILKTAIVEVLRDNREEFSELLADVIEDMAMERAIAEGENTEIVSREAIFKVDEDDESTPKVLQDLRQSLQDAKAGKINPISELWDDIDLITPIS